MNYVETRFGARFGSWPDTRYGKKPDAAVLIFYSSTSEYSNVPDYMYICQLL